ncbi:MAG: single-stranded-DNA-specific exonuclease RecJ, partial [Niameybacter sp.]
YLLNDMDKAVQRIEQTKLANEHIVIYGDYDVDGVTSTSILYMFLSEQGYSVSYYIPNRTEEGYGLNVGAIEKISKYASLVITVDTGIAATGEVAFAKELGLDMIITDHHECQEILPDALCVINPKRHDTTYPFDSLAGVGVTFKLIHAIALKENVEDKIWKYIDIVALGTIADVVPLEKENRVITYLGFKQMKETEHLGLRALLEVVQNGELKITSNVIGYQLGPRINAAGRISDAKIGVELLTTKDQERAKSIAEALDLENKKRQEMEQEILKEAEAYIEAHVDTKHEDIIIVAGKEWHHGVIGIVASRILNKYYKPTVVLTLENGIYSGSARSVEGFNIFEALNYVKGHLTRFGGHEMAAGLSLEEDRLEAFCRDLNTYGKTQLNEELLTPGLEIDLELKLEEISIGVCEELEQMEPFGVCNPTPLFAVRGLVQYAQKIGGDKHLKLAIQSNHTVLHAIGFDKGELADCLSEGEEVIVACEISKNVWNNKVSVQLRIKDVMSSEQAILKSKYYRALYEVCKEPKMPNKLELVKAVDAEPTGLSVFTEKSLMEIFTSLSKHEKKVTILSKICYNDFWSLQEAPAIFVMPSKAHMRNSRCYEWDFTSEGTYRCLNTSLEQHTLQISKMVPSYTDCKSVYKYLKHQNSSVYLHKIVEMFMSYDMTEYKLLQILDIFTELELIAYELVEEKVIYTLLQGNKTKLEHSTRYMRLQDFAQSMKKR